MCATESAHNSEIRKENEHWKKQHIDSEDCNKHFSMLIWSKWLYLVMAICVHPTGGCTVGHHHMSS